MKVNPDPDPKVVVPTSVESKFNVYVSPDREVSMPFVPPDTVNVSPWITVDEPESEEVENKVPDSCPATTCPEPLITVVPPTENAESHPVPTAIAVSVAAVPVRAPILRALSVTCASPVMASIFNTFAVLVPAVALPIADVMFNP